MNNAGAERYSKLSPIALAIAAGSISAVLAVVCAVGMSMMTPMMNGGHGAMPSMGPAMDILAILGSAVLGALLGAAVAWIYNLVLDSKLVRSSSG